jgi:hypothetical protein
MIGCPSLLPGRRRQLLPSADSLGLAPGPLIQPSSCPGLRWDTPSANDLPSSRISSHRTAAARPVRRQDMVIACREARLPPRWPQSVKSLCSLGIGFGIAVSTAKTAENPPGPLTASRIVRADGLLSELERAHHGEYGTQRGHAGISSSSLPERRFLSEGYRLTCSEPGAESLHQPTARILQIRQYQTQKERCYPCQRGYM